MKRTPLAYRSRKRTQLYIARRKLVQSLLQENPWCSIRWDDKCEGRSTEVDERLSRAAGGSILDPANCQVTCSYCHRQKHAHPAEAVARGFTIQRRSA